MPKDLLHFEVITLESVVYSAEADEILAPTENGQIGILPSHDSLVTRITPGEIIIKNNGEQIALATSGGFLEVHKNVVTILADSAEHPEDINLEEAEKSRQEALAIMRGEHGDDIDFDDALRALEHARARLKVARKIAG